MILGTQFFVTPSDSLAILAAHADCIPFFAAQGGPGAARRGTGQAKAGGAAGEDKRPTISMR